MELLLLFYLFIYFYVIGKMLICKRKKKKKKKRKLVGSITWPLMWLNKSVAAINTTFPFLDIYHKGGKGHGVGSGSTIIQ